MSEKINNILNEVKKCEMCKTISGYKKFPLKSHGNTDSEYMLVSEAPGKMSIDKKDESAIKYWMGTGGKLLRSSLAKANRELEETKTNNVSKEVVTNKELEDIFYLTDIVKCWPNENKKNRKPSKSEITSCSPFLKREIEDLKPKLILSFGEPSTKYLLNKNIIMKNYHSKIYTYNDHTKVLVLYHPSNINFQMEPAIYANQLINLFKRVIKNKIDDLEELFIEPKNSDVTRFEEVKTKNENNTSNSLIGISFIFPAPGNKITQADISKSQLRVTADFKNHFPNNNSELKFTHNGIVYNVKFTHKGSRSHILKLGSTLMKLLNLDTDSSIRIIKNNSTEFEIENIK